MLLKLIEKTVATLKKDPSYRIKLDYSTRQLIAIIHYRAQQAMRGLVRRWQFGAAEGLLFCGHSVRVEFGFMIRAGSGLILEDDVKINALSTQGIRFGNNVTLGRGAILVCTGVVANKGEGIRIGSNSAIGALSFLGGQGGITIGDNVIMGPSVRIFSENHNFEDPSVPIRKQGESRKGVVIEDDCWIGAGATILDGTVIGTGSVVAAASVVTRSVPPFSVVAGVPAKVIKSRIQPSFS